MEITTLEIFQNLLLEVRRIEKVIRDILKANEQNILKKKMKSNLIRKKELIKVKINSQFNSQKKGKS